MRFGALCSSRAINSSVIVGPGLSGSLRSPTQDVDRSAVGRICEGNLLETRLGKAPPNFIRSMKRPVSFSEDNRFRQTHVGALVYPRQPEEWHHAAWQFVATRVSLRNVVGRPRATGDHPHGKSDTRNARGENWSAVWLQQPSPTGSG